MPQKAEHTVHILEGQATLFLRRATPHWHVRYKVHGKWERSSTKCTDLAEARRRATELVTEAWFKERNGLPVVNKRFKSVARLAIKRMDELAKSGRGKATYKTYTQAIENYLIPLLGNHNVDRIDNAVLAKFEAERIELMGRVPSASVINNHNSALNRVFEEAIERGYMTKFQLPMLRNDGVKSERRPDFRLEDYTALYKGMRAWVRAARKGNETVLRNILRNYVLVLANTGIRAGTEGMNLQWQHIEFFEQDGRRYLMLHVDGKTGRREVIARHNTVRYLDRLRKLTPAWAKGTFEEFLKKRHRAYVFRVADKDMTTAFGKMFARLLEGLDLLYDTRNGKQRTMYSLRHYYATMALTYNRMTVYNLAKHLGTSVAMIEQHYGHVELRRLAHEIAGG
jgi:integrase